MSECFVQSAELLTQTQVSRGIRMGDLEAENLKTLLWLSTQLKKKKASQGIGRTRIKLAKILSDCLGIDCQPEELQPATGANRTDRRLDIYCWEVFSKYKNGLPFVAGSYDTMTDCVKAGKVKLSDGEIFADG